jgi:hypothetical protein
MARSRCGVEGSDLGGGKWNAEHEFTEREVTVLLADFAICGELFLAEQARIVQLLVERVCARALDEGEFHLSVTIGRTGRT